MKKYVVCFLGIVLLACNRHAENKVSFSFSEGLKGVPCIEGDKKNGEYLYVTAGDRLYSIGNQYGEFPDVGFHVSGEMGGVWQHPVKLLDGYTLTLTDATIGNNQTLGKSSAFRTYPFASQFDYELLNGDWSVIRTDFVPDGLPVLVTEYLIRNMTSDKRNIRLSFHADTDLMPVWLGERCGMVDSRDKLLDTQSPNLVYVKDSLNDWFVGLTSDVDTMSVSTRQDSARKGMGIDVQLHLPELSVAPHETKCVRFYIGGSTKNTDEIQQNLTHAKADIAYLFNCKKQRFAEIDRTATITIPDTLLMQAYQWGKYTTDWLVRDVPELGRGINAGLPDYPWFFSNDQAAAFSALYGTRDPELFMDSWKMMLDVSNKANDHSGRIIHEVSSNGVVFDIGRMEESQGFIVAAYAIFKWTGDKGFLRMYYEQGKRVWDFLKQHDKNNNLFIEGAGGVEIEGLNDEMLDVAVSTYAYFNVMAEMANVFAERDVAEDFAAKARMLKERINRDWWLPSENRYADFLTDKKKALQLIDSALRKRVSDDRNLWAGKKLTELRRQITEGSYKEKGYVVFYNPSTLMPLIEHIADADKAQAVLKGMPFFTNKYGLYIVGLSRPDDITLEEGSVAHRLKGEFNYYEAIMPVATSELAIAECEYNGTDAGMKYIKQIVNNFNFATPGSTYEVSPDYGMFVQAWNVKGINVPLIRYVFGVDPYAYAKHLTIRPDMPSEWNFARLENLLVGDTKLGVDFRREDNRQVYTITSAQEGWNIDFIVPRNGKSVKVNGKDEAAPDGVVSIKGKENRIEIVN